MKITPKPLAVNFTTGRAGVRPDVIVLHIQQGTMAGTDSWFRSSQSKVSAHYGVSKAGQVVEWVDPDDQAWHAGRVARPTAEIVKERPGRNPNSYSIGIECEGFADEETPAPQVAAVVELVGWLCKEYGIPKDYRHIIGHREVFADKSCPGKLPVDLIIARVADGWVPAETPPTGDGRPQPGDVRWSAYLGDRVILTEYSSDTDYKFIRAEQLRGLGGPGSSPWSKLPKVGQ